MLWLRRALAVGAVFLIGLSTMWGAVEFTGINLNGAEYGETQIPGIYGVDYIYPSFSEVNHFLEKGMNTFRVPFLWERIQPVKSGSLDAAELERLDIFVDYATGSGAHVILDPHNFAAYYGEVIGAPGGSVTADDFASLWFQLATHYADNDRVIFGLMNEPVGLGDSLRPGGTTEAWLVSANTAIAAIRDAGASNLILVPGNGYTGAWSWLDDFYGTPNGEVMLGVVDPLNNFAYEVHQYMDADSSGRSTEVVSPTIGAERLADFTLWLRENGARGFLGEFAASGDPLPLTALDIMLDHIDANDDVWIGWTYWFASAWNTGDPFNIEPVGGADRPQLAVLQEHLAAVPEPGTVCLLAVGLGLAAFLGRRAQAAARQGGGAQRGEQERNH